MLTETEDVFQLKARVEAMVIDGKLILRNNNNIIKFRQWNDFMLECLTLWRKGGSEKYFYNELEKKHPGKWGELESQFNNMILNGFFKKVNSESKISEFENQRWKRTLDFLSDFDQDYADSSDRFENIRNSHVLLVGTGGLGSWVIYQLLCLGVGEITLVDGDRVSLDNLNRSIIFDESDVGELKTTAAQRKSNSFSPSTKINTISQYINSPADLEQHLENVDLIIGCADEPFWSIKEYLTKASINTSTPLLIHGGGRVGPFLISKSDTCPMCEASELLQRKPEIKKQIEIQKTLPKGHSGGMSASASIVAGVIAFEVFRFLTKYKTPETINHVWEYKGINNCNLIPTRKYKNCDFCGS